MRGAADPRPIGRRSDAWGSQTGFGVFCLQRCCVFEFGESLLRALRRGEVALSLVARARLLERGGRLVGASGNRQYFAEVGVRVSPVGRQVGPLGERDRLARETFGLLRLSATCEHFRPYLP